MESSSWSGSTKRAKALCPQVVQCLVDGCNADLSQCREYHRRHKVCELHSKTPKVTISGLEQRFCQQCSRFHSLVEFDEGKRSCRKRLDGHNRRRRKPQPDAHLKNHGLIFSSQQGISFDNPTMFQSPSSDWGAVGRAENDRVLYHNQLHQKQNWFQESSGHAYRGGSQIQFLQGAAQSLPESSITQPLIDPNSSSENSRNNQKLFPAELVNSDRALSLLSPAPPVSMETALSHMVHADMRYGGLGHYSFSQQLESNPQVSAASDSHTSTDAALNFEEMLQRGTEGEGTSGSQRTHTFMWD